MTLGEYLGSWLRDTKPTVAFSTWRDYEGHVRIHLAPLHGVPLERLGPPDIRALLLALGEQDDPPSPTTIGKTLTVLKMALNRAVDDELIIKNPAARVKRPRAVPRQPTFWEEPDIKKFLGAVSGDRWEALYKLAIATGMRRGEIVRLTWRDIDLAASTVKVREAKTKAGVRTIPVAHFAAQALAALPKDSVFVFATRAGQPVDGRNLNRWFEEAVARAGVPRIRFHDLRHSAASLMLAQGVPPRTVQGILGHSTMAMTMNIYGHVSAGSSRDAANVMEEALR